MFSDNAYRSLALTTMNISNSLRHLSMATCLYAAIILSVALSAHAEGVSPEMVKMAGAIPLTKDLFAHVKSFLQKVTDDAAVKTDFVKMGGDKDMSPDSANSIVTKYPKVEAALNSSSLKPDEFMKAWGVLMVAPALADAEAPVDDKAAQANVDFCKANADEVKSLTQAIENLERAAASP
jgi:hypothetical protein